MNKQKQGFFWTENIPLCINPYIDYYGFSKPHRGPQKYSMLKILYCCPTTILYLDDINLLECRLICLNYK